MNKTLRGMTLAAMLLSASSSAFADQNDVDYAGDGFVTPAAFVGDVPSSSEDAYFASNKREAAQAMQKTAKRARTAQYAKQPAAQQAAQYPVQQTAQTVQHAAPSAQLRPLNVAAAPVQQCGCAMGGACTMSGCDSMMGSGYAAPSCGCDSGGCDGGCGMSFAGPSCGCDSGSCDGGCGLGFAGPSCGCDSGGCDGGCGLKLGSRLNLGGHGGCDSIGCGTMFGGGCDSMGCSKGRRGKGKGLASALGLCGKSGWARHEALLWFIQDRNSPSLATT